MSPEENYCSFCVKIVQENVPFFQRCILALPLSLCIYLEEESSGFAKR
jgi:hypothetical protein